MARMGDRRDAYRVLAEKPERRKPLGRPRRRWEDDIKMDFQQVEGGMELLDLAQDRNRWRDRVNAVVNLRCP